MRNPHLAPVLLGASLALVLVSACEGSRPPRAAQTEMVPSNSSFESSSARPQIVGEPPSEGVPAGGNGPASAGGGPTPAPGTGPAPGQTANAGLPSAPTGPTPAVDPKNSKPPTRAECTQVIDHFVDLEVKSNPALSGIPPEMVKSMLAQAKMQASAQKGDPCTEEKITRAKYNCGMAAQTPDAWKSCMK